MADDFFNQRYHTQRVNQDISKDLEALETPTGAQEERNNLMDLEADSDPFKVASMDDDGDSTGCSIDDLLNGYVRDEQTLSAIDECLLYLSSEWDLTEILSKDIRDVERLINHKCKSAAQQLTVSIIDPANVIYDTLLRLARKMQAVELVTNNQKMIYIPVKI